MKIDNDFIKKIYNMKIKLNSKSDKIKLAEYSELIPMYDIYTDMVYMVPSNKLHSRLLKSHYRFITDEVKQWILNKLEKPLNNRLKTIYTNNLAIIDNYDLPTLEKTSYDTLYRYSPDLGMALSICKRNSFNRYSYHLTPYYSKDELIKLGMNNNIITKVDPKIYIDKDLHYKICKKVSKNDISSTTILEHMNAIIQNEAIGWVVFYSMTGSYLFNKILREHLPMPQYLYDGLNKLITINTSLPNDYYFYRFVWDDKYIATIKVGEIFIDDGFTSTTRDPFYSPGIKMDFGLILLKINIPKDMKNSGLLMENFSMFPKEEEFIIQPHCKLKLIQSTGDDKTPYYHLNTKFEKLIKKRYEFELVETSNKWLKEIKINDDIPTIDILMELNGRDRVDIFTQFLDKCNSLGHYSFKNMIFIAQWFDSTKSYQHLYHNSTADGFITTCYDNGYPILSIECGEVLVVNYIRTKCYYDKVESITSIDEIVALYCRLFKYKTAIIYFTYNNFTEFKANYDIDTEPFLYTNLYCATIYNYFKKQLTLTKYYKFEYGFWKLDAITKQKVPVEILNKLPLSNVNLTWSELFIIVVEKYFHLYKKMEEWFNEYHDNLFKSNYYIFNSVAYLTSKGYSFTELPDFKHTSSRDRGDMFRIVYDEITRRV